LGTLSGDLGSDPHLMTLRTAASLHCLVTVKGDLHFRRLCFVCDHASGQTFYCDVGGCCQKSRLRLVSCVWLAPRVGLVNLYTT